MSTSNNNSSRGQTSARSASPQRAVEHRQRLSPSTVGSVYPALETLQRISHGQHRQPPPSSSVTSGGDATGVANPAAIASGSGGHYQRRQSPPVASSSVQGQGPAVVSHQVLPTYRQASVSGDGTTPAGHPSSGSESPPYIADSALPDILYSHMVPQVPPARPNQHRHNRNRNRRSGGEEGQSSRGHRHRHRSHGERSSRHHRRSRTQSSSSAQTQEGTCKEPCVKCVVTITSFRWVLVVLSILGVCCVVTGIVLAALHAAGNSFLFLAIMFIGLGVLLVIVVGVGWKCTPRGHEPLHALFGIGSFRHGQTRERRHRRHRNRDGNWFGGVLYPEFQYRRPPPSYAASMQDYQNQVRQEQEPTPHPGNSTQGNNGSLPSSPPPSYRSRASTAHSGIHIAFPPQDGDQPNSRPPTYRSRAPSRRPSIPREETPRSSTADSDNGDRAPPDVSFAGGSSIQITHDNAGPASSSPSHNVTGGASVTEVRSGSSSPPSSSSVTMQVYTMPVTRGNQEAENQNSTTTRNNTQNLSSDPTRAHQMSSSSSTPSPSSLSPQHQPSSTGRREAGRPSLHQRMASEDRHILEQTLQSLEDHMNESGGITNEGASFDEPDQPVAHVNTHL